MPLPLARLIFMYNNAMARLWLGLVVFSSLWSTFWGALPAAANETSPRSGVTLVEPGIPLEALDPGGREKAQSVLNKALFSQAVRGMTSRSRPEVFEYLLDHPDFAATVARVLNVTRYRIEQRGDEFWLDDRSGTTGYFKLLFADPRRRLYLARLQYSKPLLPTLEGQVLILLEYEHLTDGTGEPVVEQQILGYAAPENTVTGTLAQLAYSLSPSKVEDSVTKKVRRLFRHVAAVTQIATDDPEGLVERLTRAPEVAPDRLEAFRTILMTGRTPAWASAVDSLRLLEPSPLALPDDLR